MSTRRSSSSESGTIQGVLDAGCHPHDPDLYSSTAISSTAHPVLPPSTIDDDLRLLLESFDQDGFLVFEESFSNQQVGELEAAIDELITGMNMEFSSDYKKIVNSGIPPDFTSGAKIPWVQYEHTGKTSDLNDNVLDPSIADRVRKLMGFTGYSQVMDQITVNNQRLLSLVAKLLDCDEVDELELFQDMALLKPPKGREKPWHQDKAYFNISLETKVVGCWIALDEATCENGCMRMLRGGHKKGPMMHFADRDYQICDKDAPSLSKGHDVVAIQLPPGGLVLFDGMMPHGTPTNMTNSKRRALQYHWVKRGAKRVGENDPGGRVEIFGGAANGASC